MPPALAAPAPGLLSPGVDIAAAVFGPRIAGFRVLVPVAPALPLPAGCAQATIRLVRMPGAPGAFSLCNAFIRTPAGAPVFGLAGLGIPDTPDACGLALPGADSIGSTAFLKTHRALAATGLGLAFAAARAEPACRALLGSAPMALSVIGASLAGVAVRQGRCLLDRWMNDVGGPAGAGERTRCAITGGSAVAAAPDPKWHGNRSTGRLTSSRVLCKQ